MFKKFVVVRKISAMNKKSYLSFFFVIVFEKCKVGRFLNKFFKNKSMINQIVLFEMVYF